MKFIFFLTAYTCLVACRQDEQFQPSYYSCNNALKAQSETNPSDQKYMELLEGITHSGVPGILMAIQDTTHGMWSGASGKADLANNIDLLPCNITRVGSTVKTFTAATILLLQEENKLDLDDPITAYLSRDYLKDIANAGQATIRQLLQHSSGIYNYIVNLKFQTSSLNNLTKVWQPEELLSYARNKKANFAPGTDVQYSNTNYILLGKIIEEVEHKPFYEVFEEKIFRPLGLNATICAAKNPVPKGIIRGYVDFYSNLDVINTTYYSGWDYYTADGGLISNPVDLCTFMNALFTGNLLSPESLEEMMTWKTPRGQSPQDYNVQYGLGIFLMETPYGEAYMHSGDAIGYAASMFYFPRQHTTISWAVNGNYGKIDAFTQSPEAMEKIFGCILGSEISGS
jgi:D-alanyl-D-alanine carboxypeptidase